MTDSKKPDSDKFDIEPTRPPSGSIPSDKSSIDADFELAEGSIEPTRPPSGPIPSSTSSIDTDFELAEGSIAPTLPPSDGAPSETRSMQGGSKQQTNTIGPYRLLQKVGEGGMGAVWLADQKEPVRRRVALKLIKPGLADEQIIARFEAERQALAMMDHQNIARVLDGGTTEQNTPYFVMELVNGIPISDYCDKHKLNITQRLELFVPVCQAIQHAHHKGIIHRDLKPSNVLVATIDGKPTPKVIDFGLAKAIQHTTRLTDKTVFTEFGRVVGTVQYMSPEQAESDTTDIDARTDIYSLGVMLYELLAGSTPIDKETIGNGTLLKILEMVREKEPPRPSERLSGSGEAMTGIGEQRKIPPAKLQNILRGELDWIVMKAIEKDRERRYETANGFAEDIQRFLNDEPVLAKPPSFGYRSQKFVKKNRGLVAALAVITTSLIGGIAGTTWFGMKANTERSVAIQERNRADKESDRARVAEKLAKENAAEAKQNELTANQNAQKAQTAQLESEKSAKRSFDVLKVVTDAFKSTNPNAGSDSTMTAKDVLLNAQSALENSELDDEGQSLLRRSLTKSFIGLGDFKVAFESAEAEVKTRTRLFGEDDHQTKISKADLAAALAGLGKSNQAIEVFTSLIESEKDNENRVDSDYYSWMSNLAGEYLKAGKAKQAIELLEEVYQASLAANGAGSQDTLVIQNSLANAYMIAGKRGQATKLLEECLASVKTSLGDDHPTTLTVKNNLANFYQDAGKYEAAKKMLVETLEARTLKLGEEHPDTIRTMNSLAGCLDSLGQKMEALKLHEKELAIAKRVFGSQHPDTLLTMNSLAASYEAVGRTADALKLFKQTAAGLEAVLGPKHPQTLRAIGNLAATYLGTDEPEKAIPFFERAIEGRMEVLGPNDPATIITKQNLATLHHRMGDFEKAIELKQDTLKSMVKAMGPEHPNSLHVKTSLAASYLASEKADNDYKSKAIKLLEDSLISYKKVLPKLHPSTMRTVTQLRRAYADVNDANNYSKILEKELTTLKQLIPDESPQWGTIYAETGSQLLALKKFERAKELLSESVKRRTATSPDDWLTSNTRSMLGEAVMELKDYDAADPLLTSSYSDLKKQAKQIPESVRAVRIGAALERLVRHSKLTKDSEAEKKWQTELQDLQKSLSADTEKGE